jgi:hypothetical protein
MIKIKIMKIIYKYIHDTFIYMLLYRKKSIVYSNFTNIELIEILDDNNYYIYMIIFFSFIKLYNLDFTSLLIIIYK